SSGGRVGEADDRSLIIDRRGRIPGIASDVPKVSRNTVLPKHGVSSADTSNRHTAIAGDADHLTRVIDCCRCAGAVARQRWEFLHLAVRLPDHRPELQDLERRIASWIVDTILCPPELGQRCGGTVFPISAGRCHVPRRLATRAARSSPAAPTACASRSAELARCNYGAAGFCGAGPPPTVHHTRSSRSHTSISSIS